MQHLPKLSVIEIWKKKELEGIYDNAESLHHGQCSDLFKVNDLLSINRTYFIEFVCMVLCQPIHYNYPTAL